MHIPKHPSDSILNIEGKTSISNHVPIGNYKGVMLCNRPFADGANSIKDPKKQKTGNNLDGERSFICGTVAQPWGCNVAIDEKARVLSRLSKKDGVLSKHKKWLNELQKKKEQLEKEREKEMMMKEEKKKKFTQREAKKRAWIKKEEEAIRYVLFLFCDICAPIRRHFSSKQKYHWNLNI